MCHCWEEDPQNRPTFKQIYDSLKGYLRKSNPLTKFDQSVNPSHTSPYEKLHVEDQDSQRNSSCALETSVKTSHMSLYDVPAQVELHAGLSYIVQNITF